MKINYFIIIAFFSFLNSSIVLSQKKLNLTQTTTNPGKIPKEITETVPEKLYTNLTPGSLAPDVVKVDIDYFIGMVDGVCMVRKGNLETIIDLKGNPIVPWGKYKFEYRSIFTKLFTVREIKSNKLGCINSKGEIVIPIIYSGIEPFAWFQMTKVSDIAGNKKVLDTKGNILSDNLLSYIDYREGRHLIHEKQDFDRIEYYKNGTVTSGEGFMNSKGTIVIPNKFNMVLGFTEGLAPVLNTNQFGEKKWGFIDKSGQLVIPYTYQLTPGNFHNGLAFVTPKDKSDFDFAYIDKKGDVKIKIGKNEGILHYEPLKLGVFSHSFPLYSLADFTKGYSFWTKDQETLLLDTTGNFSPLNKLIKDPNLNALENRLIITSHDDLGIYFTRDRRNNDIRNWRGLVDYDGYILFPPDFYDLKPDYYSRYALADKQISYDVNGFIKGVINSQGIFVLIIKEKTPF